MIEYQQLSLFFVDMQRANPSDLQERKLPNKEEIHIKDLLHLCIQDDSALRRLMSVLACVSCLETMVCMIRRSDILLCDITV